MYVANKERNNTLRLYTLANVKQSYKDHTKIYLNVDPLTLIQQSHLTSMCPHVTFNKTLSIHTPMNNCAHTDKDLQLLIAR